MQYRRVQFQTPTWQGRIGIVLASALGVGLAVALIILTLGFAILLLPVVAVVLGIAWWRWRKIEAAMREQAASDPTGGDRTIEIDYRVVGDPEGRRGE